MPGAAPRDHMMRVIGAKSSDEHVDVENDHATSVPIAS